MKIDYSKSEYTKDEIKMMALETEYLKERNPSHIPILIQLDSNILNIDKQKFLVSEDIIFSDFINNSLRKKLINLYNNDVLTINVIRFSGQLRSVEIKSQPKSMSEIYNEYKDPETNLLILRLKRNTTYKTIKSCIKYISGY